MADIPQVAFTRGEASPIAAARTDQAFYTNAVALAQNFFSRAEGGLSNRPGLQYIATCQSNTPNGSYMLPFVYSNQQSYLTEFAAGSISIYANGAPVQSGIANPYAIGDLPNLRWAQSADTLNVVVNSQTPYELKRQTASSFTFSSPTLLNGPFQDINTDGTTYVYTSGTQGTVDIFASSGIFQPTHVGALFTIQEQYLSSIEPWEADKLLTPPMSTASPVGMYLRSDGKIYKCVNALPATSATATGSFQPVHTSGTQADGNGQTIANDASVVGVYWQFVSTNAGVAQITQYLSPTHVKGIVQSDKGVWSNFPPTVVGGPVTTVGPFSFAGTGSAVTFSPLTAITTGDPNQFFVTVGGVFQDPTTYSISLTGTSITFFQAPANGAPISVTQVVGTLLNIYQSSVIPTAMQGLCVSTYWAFGSLSKVQGFPGLVVYFNDRRVYAGTSLQPQTTFMSKVSTYVDYGVSNPQVDSDAITFTINARLQNPIVDLIPLNDLLIGTASAIWRVTHSASVGAITPNDISLLPQNFYGQHPVPSVQTGDTVIYVQWGGRKIRDISYQFAYDKFLGQELTVFARHMFPFGTTCTRMAFAPEPFGLLFCVRSDGVLCVCAYLPEQQVNAWTRYVTAGFFEDVCVIPENGTYSVYVIVRRQVNGATVRYIERFAAREYATNLDSFFVDSGLTYDGRNTTTATMTVTGGTSWQANDTGTLIASSSAGWGGFQATDPANNNGIWLFDSSGNRLTRLQITAYLSATQVTVKFITPVPASVQGIPTVNWTYAKTNFSGLTNLTGQQVSIFADGGTMAPVTVSNAGSFTLPTAAGVVHAGLPYTCQIQSLNFNRQQQPPIRNKKKSAKRLSVVVDESTTFFCGPDFAHLVQAKVRQFENYGQPISPHTGVLHVQMTAMESDDAVVCIQHTDPVPLTVLAWFADVSDGRAG